MKTKQLTKPETIILPRFIDLQPEPMVVREVGTQKFKGNRIWFATIQLADDLTAGGYVAVSLVVPWTQRKEFRKGQAILCWFPKGGGSQPLKVAQLPCGRLALPYYGLIELPLNDQEDSRFEYGVGHAQTKWARETK